MPNASLFCFVAQGMGATHMVLGSESRGTEQVIGDQLDKKKFCGQGRLCSLDFIESSIDCSMFSAL